MDEKSQEKKCIPCPSQFREKCMVSFTFCIKGKSSKLCYQGNMYTKHATRKTNKWWKCVKRSSTWCRGSLSTTLQNENPVLGQPHNHAPSDTSIKYSKTRNAMKDLATNTRDKPSQIFAQVVSQCDDNVQSLLSLINVSSKNMCHVPGWARTTNLSVNSRTR